MAPIWSDIFPRCHRERWLLAGCALLAVLAVAAPAFDGGTLHSHDFADQRGWLGIPCAWDVLSNLPFVLFGAWGLTRLAHGPLPGGAAAQVCATLFFAGLVFTGVGSSFYHWHADDAGLTWDRAAMVVPFAGMLGLAACERVSARAGLALAAFALAGGLVCVAAWRLHGNVWPWGVLQFGGMAVVLALACVRPRAGTAGLQLGAVIAIYAVAKALEMADAQVFGFTQGVVSGHSLKHLAASLVAVPVLMRVRPAWPAAAVRHNDSGSCRRTVA